MFKLSLVALVATAAAIKINDDAAKPPSGSSGEGLGTLEAEIGGAAAAPEAKAVPEAAAAPKDKAAPVA